MMCVQPLASRKGSAFDSKHRRFDCRDFAKMWDHIHKFFKLEVVPLAMTLMQYFAKLHLYGKVARARE